MKSGRQSRNLGGRIKFINLIIFAFLAFLLLCSAELWARPVTRQQAEKTVKGWLKADVQPLGMALGRNIIDVETFSYDNGQPIYYVVYLQPSGFVIVAADDLVEPIVCFVSGGRYEDSDDNPLGALVRRDIPDRVAAAQVLQATLDAHPQKKNLAEEEATFQRACIKARSKWDKLSDYADIVKTDGIPSISEVWVDPIVQSKWSQGEECSEYCYNYYTPEHFVCGCVATAMAQLMRYHQYPTTGIGDDTFEIYVEGSPQDANTLGGDGAGGPYNWSDMVLDPSCGNYSDERWEAIGALCYDAGVAAHMDYGELGSGAYMSDARDALVYPFLYTNAICRDNYPDSIPINGLNGMINPNLDAEHPVILGISNSGGHAILADGYGYDSETLYHHLNMGWAGYGDAWYNLPDISGSGYTFDIVDTCIYNIFTSGTGEIISGRVTNASDEPISGVTVEAEGTAYTDETDEYGIYALAKVPSGTAFTISATKSGWNFSSQEVSTGTSSGSSNTSGNCWGVNFVGIEAGVDYCLASGGGDEYISDVVVGDINNTGTGSGGYVDYTAMSTEMGIGQSYLIEVTNGNPYSGDLCGIWVDWDGDKDFYDPNETIPVFGSPGVGPYNAVITVPADANFGDTQMRIRIQYGGTLSPCDDTDYGEVEDYTITVTEPYGCSVTEGFETGDFTSLDWTHSGDADWIVTSDESYSGTYSARAGVITHNQSSSLELTANCIEGYIIFYQKVSSESGYDFLRFYIDGEKKDEWSGDKDWELAFFPVSAGVRTFKWTYSKDGSVSRYSDTGWIDDIEFPIECKYCGGSGTAQDPYLICTAEQMQQIGAEPNDWDKHFKLMADIDLGGYTGTTYNIIGTSDADAFAGTFNGNGYTISNFTYATTDTNCIGLFGCVDDPNAKIENLGLTDPDIDAGEGDVIGSIVGVIINGTVSNCYARRGGVSGGMSVGGLVGKNDDSVSNCYSTTTVAADANAGGLVGWNSSGAVSSCYSTGVVSADANAGGLIGISDGMVTDCFWDVNSSGLDTSDGGTGKTTAEMHMESTFTNWDFTTPIWEICEGMNYPKLAWQIPLAGDFVCPDGVEMRDFAILAAQWLQAPGAPSADIAPEGGDGVVNWLDLEAFVDNWLEGFE